MKAALRLGNLFGIDVTVDYSWFIVFGLVAWSLAGHVFPMGYPDWPRGLMWGLGLLTSLLFFASVLAHEFGHSLVSQRSGVPVRRITLFIFGGLAEITGEPRRPGDEFAMALAGPAVSLVLGLAFLALSRVAGPGTPLEGLASWLGRINLTLAAFNLIPGFPLDGGRVLRALVWGATGSLARATRLAATSGQVVAYGFMAWGLFQGFGGNWVNGIWLIFIAWFLLGAAQTSVRQLTLQELLRGHTAREVMMADCPRVAPDLSIQQLVDDHLLASGRRCFPVVSDGAVVGIVTLADVKRVPRAQWEATPIRRAMTPLDQLKAVRPDESLYNVLERLAAADVNQLPVVENGRFLGIVARDNVLRVIQTKAELAA